MRYAVILTTFFAAVALGKRGRTGGSSSSSGGDDDDDDDTSAAPSSYALFAVQGIPFIPPNELQASMVDSSASATTYAVDCIDGEDCGLQQPYTVTQGPSTFTASAVYSTETGGGSAAITVTEDCVLVASSKAATCSLSYSVSAGTKGVAINTALATTTTYNSQDIAYATVTAAPNAAPRYTAGAVVAGAAAVAAAAAFL